MRVKADLVLTMTDLGEGEVDVEVDMGEVEVEDVEGIDLVDHCIGW